MNRTAIAAALVALLLAGGARVAHAASGEQLTRESRAALQSLREGNAAARTLAASAKGILVFPSMVKAGFLFGGQIGEGTLLKGGVAAGYYNSVAASYGLQAGAQTFGYALFFMDQKSLAGFESSSGFEIGVGPSIVLVDEGAARNLTTTTARSGVYAFIFDQKGLMGGIGIQGSKITRISK